jgi:predicted exporter
MKLLRNLRHAYLAVLTSLVVGALTLLTSNPAFDTNIMSLLPQIYRDHASETVLKAQTNDAGGRVVVVVKSPSSANAEREAFRVAGEMTASGLFSRVDARVSTTELKPIADLFFRYPFQLARSALSDVDAAQVVSQAQERLFAPDGVQWAQSLSLDPLALFPLYLQPLLSSGGAFTISNGFIHRDTPESKNVLVLARIKGSVYSREVQDSVVRHLESLSVPHPSSLLTSGIVFFAHESAGRTESEVKSISTATLVAVLALFLVVFRSLTPLLVIGAFLATSFLGALLITNLCTELWHQQPLHLITLGFGSCLLGVSVDYAIHFFVAHNTSPVRADRSPLERIGSGLTLGFLTTAIGFLGIAFSPFPGLQQLAIFCIAGLILAVSTVSILLPWIAGPPRARTNLESLASLTSLMFHPTVGIITALSVVLILLIGIPRVKASDDIRTLNTPSPALLAKQREVAELMGMIDGGSAIVVEGASEDEVLHQEELLVTRLEGLKREKKVRSYRAMSELVPSKETQRSIYRSYSQAYASAPETFLAYGRDMHLNTTAVATLETLKSAEPTTFATPQECLTTGACKAVEDLWHGGPNGDFIGTISLEGFKGDSAAITQGIPGTRLVNHADAISSALRSYRVSATETAALFYFGVYLLITFRYGLRNSWRVITPAAVGAATAMAALGLAGIPLNVFSVFALIVLLGVGIDYAIFFAEDDEVSSSTSLAVVLSATTTIISFGALYFSSTPALQSFGVVLSVGVLFAALLAPLAQGARGKR